MSALALSSARVLLFYALTIPLFTGASYTGDAMRYSESGPGQDTAADRNPNESLYFFPDQNVSESRVRSILHDGSLEERAWVISHLLRFAQWDDIWTYVSREEVREIFAQVEMPENLQSAWARMLKIEAPVA